MPDSTDPTVGSGGMGMNVDANRRRQENNGMEDNASSTSYSGGHTQGQQKQQPKYNFNIVVSDAMAKNSRQLLYAHIYNYLLQNRHFETAKQFLKEADVPISTNNTNDNTSTDFEGLNLPPQDGLNPRELLPTKMLMNSPDTFLLEWWEFFWAMTNAMSENSLESLQNKNFVQERVFPIVPQQVHSVQQQQQQVHMQQHQYQQQLQNQLQQQYHQQMQQQLYMQLLQKQKRQRADRTQPGGNNIVSGKGIPISKSQSFAYGNTTTNPNQQQPNSGASTPGLPVTKKTGLSNTGQQQQQQQQQKMLAQQYMNSLYSNRAAQMRQQRMTPPSVPNEPTNMTNMRQGQNQPPEQQQWHQLQEQQIQKLQQHQQQATLPNLQGFEHGDYPDGSDPNMRQQYISMMMQMMMPNQQQQQQDGFPPNMLPTNTNNNQPSNAPHSREGQERQMQNSKNANNKTSIAEAPKQRKKRKTKPKKVTRANSTATNTKNKEEQEEEEEEGEAPKEKAYSNRQTNDDTAVLDLNDNLGFFDMNAFPPDMIGH